MSLGTSPRLPGVPLLLPHSTGPEYSRWRRSIQFALETRDLWKYCNGKCPMPMPEAGPIVASPNASTANLQPSLLEERRAWVKQDREVKLDIFLSLTEEVMHEVFDVGPPLPPSSLSAKGMIEALDSHFAVFKFEPYHHAFCHFLNLHVDQFASIQEFNQEFSAVLEDLVDHGHPLSNTQACSAYFSKLRCTQNPWVAKKLDEWDAQPEDIGIIDLIRESPPWPIIRPLATKSSQTSQESIPEEHLEDTDEPGSEAGSDSSSASTVSSFRSHSRQSSSVSMKSTEPSSVSDLIKSPSSTANSLEITIGASSDDIAEIDPQAFRKHLEKLPSGAIPERGSSKNHATIPFSVEEPLPEWLSSRKSIARRPLPPPHNRPLPPLPPQAQQVQQVQQEQQAQPVKETAVRPRSASPRGATQTLQIKAATARVVSLRPPPLRLETTHPTLRPNVPLQPPTEVHPAFRTTTPSSSEQLPLHPAQRPVSTSPTSSRPATATGEILQISQDSSTSATSLAVPWPSTPKVPNRPHSSRAALPSLQAPNPHPSQIQPQPESESPPLVQTEVSTSPFITSDIQQFISSLPMPIAFEAHHPEPEPTAEPQPSRHSQQQQLEPNPLTLLRTHSSEICLPLQGTRDSAWDYLYESKGGYLLSPPPAGHNPSPRRQPTASPSPSPAPFQRTPMVEDAVVSLLSSSTSPDNSSSSPQPTTPMHHRLKASSLDFVARLSGDSMFESCEAAREKDRRERKKKSWSVGVGVVGGLGGGLARLTASGGRGVKEII